MPRKKAAAPAASEGAPTETAEAPRFLSFELPPISDHATVSVKDLILDAGTQSRVNLNQDKIEEYTGLIKEAAKRGEPYPFPRIEVMRTADGSLYVIEGFHRTHANKQAHNKEVEVDIREGTLEEAIIFSLQANATHGLPRTTQDKVRSLKTFFKITPVEQVKTMSNVDIAKVIGVSEGFVRNHRDAAHASTSRVVTRGGKKVSMDTSGIGSKGGSKRAKKSAERKAAKKSGKKPEASSEDGEKPKETAAEKRLSLIYAEISKAIGGREGDKIVEAIVNGSLPLTPKQVKDWAGLNPETIKAVAPLVAHHGWDPWKAFQFIKSELADKVVEDLQLRAIAAGGKYEFEKDGLTITVKVASK